MVLAPAYNPIKTHGDTWSCCGHLIHMEIRSFSSISRVSSIHSNPQGPDSCCSAANNSVTKPGEALILTVSTDIIMAIGYPRGKPNFLYLAHVLDSLHTLQHQSGPYPFLHFSPCTWYLYVDWSSLLFIDRNGMIPLLA